MTDPKRMREFVELALECGVVYAGPDLAPQIREAFEPFGVRVVEHPLVPVGTAWTGDSLAEVTERAKEIASGALYVARQR